MKRTFFNLQSTNGRWACIMIFMLSFVTTWGQENGEKATEELVNLGFENVRWTENDNERIYTIENNVYKAQGVGIAKAVDAIQAHGLPKGKTCTLIVTHLDVPQVALTYRPTNGNDTTIVAGRLGWQTSYELEDSWKEVKKEKKK